MGRASQILWFALLPLVATTSVGTSSMAAEPMWRVAKVSGDARLTTPAARTAVLTADTVVGPGETASTGRNGRVLLVHGEGDESILIAPDSVVAIPAAANPDTTSTILHRAGSILVKAEKSLTRSLAIRTPYLAAVGGDAEFRVTLGDLRSSVDVVRGQIEVTDLRSGQHALVLPHQRASVPTVEFGGLSLSGSGSLSPILTRDSRPSTTAAESRAAGLSTPTQDARDPLSEPDAPRTVEPLPPLSAQPRGWDNPLRRAFEILGESIGLRARRGAAEDDTMITIAVAAGVGLLVALVVGVLHHLMRKSLGAQPSIRRRRPDGTSDRRPGLRRARPTQDPLGRLKALDRQAIRTACHPKV
ncbi:MAG: hypothetical protein HXX10_03400 [Rhodoplanes sp.]|uniref:hypothetical protein n=1 Tax=Rhodoplanes sp. TaxID=1968906 RepID=UPI0017958B86|nr:hypothetical protein [Rhodoplanes sp.]NVO13060.1 hypothetical protein [Rhodoplanes sp.]